MHQNDRGPSALRTMDTIGAKGARLCQFDIAAAGDEQTRALGGGDVVLRGAQCMHLGAHHRAIHPIKAQHIESVVIAARFQISV